MVLGEEVKTAGPAGSDLVIGWGGVVVVMVYCSCTTRGASRAHGVSLIVLDTLIFGLMLESLVWAVC